MPSAQYVDEDGSEPVRSVIPRQAFLRRTRDLVIVSNRSPKNFVWQDGQWRSHPATSALAIMLGPLVHRSDVSWYCCVSEPPEARKARHKLPPRIGDQTGHGLDVVPVVVPADVYDAYYGKVSNQVLWLLQHGLVDPGGCEFLDPESRQAWTTGYQLANQLLADALVDSTVSTRAFLVHDYHLYPLPGLLRRAFPDTPMLHFTHIPFPRPNVLGLLPRDWWEGVLSGLLGADVAGFQTDADVRAFLACCEELLKAPIDPDARAVRSADERWVRARTYPASVDPDELRRAVQSIEAREARRRLAEHFAGRIIVRVDRLDPSKNQIVGFLAFARMLQHHPEMCGRVRFLAFLVPSRTNLSTYRAYRDEVFRTVEQINASFAERCARPVIQVFYVNDRAQALIAMERCDVLLANSRADGMNLVVKEWAIVSRRPGALVVSETAGVAAEAAHSGLLVSPLDIAGTAEALANALKMSTADRAARLACFRERIHNWTAKEWLQAQLTDLRL